MQLKTCKVCDKQVKRKDKVFCSTKCYYSTRTGARNNKWKGGKLTITCKSCSKVFHVDRDRADAKTCSQVCNKQYRKSEEFRMTASKRARKQILEQYGETPKFITKLEQIIHYGIIPIALFGEFYHAAYRPYHFFIYIVPHAMNTFTYGRRILSPHPSYVIPCKRL